MPVMIKTDPVSGFVANKDTDSWLQSLHGDLITEDALPPSVQDRLLNRHADGTASD